MVLTLAIGMMTFYRCGSCQHLGVHPIQIGTDLEQSMDCQNTNTLPPLLPSIGFVFCFCKSVGFANGGVCFSIDAGCRGTVPAPVAIVPPTLRIYLLDLPAMEKKIHLKLFNHINA